VDVGLLQRLISNLWGSRRDENVLWLYVRCGRCEEAIRLRVDLLRDLEELYESQSDFPSGYALHKEVMGQRCFKMMRVELTLDSRKRPLEQRIEGGRFITREEYNRVAAGADSAASGH
jgi:hypothetical protein